MTRSDLQKISILRKKEAKTLLDAQKYPGAYYLIGYAVECALKACVAKQVKKYDFPEKSLANEVFTHDLEKLLRVAGLTKVFEDDKKINPALELNWAIVKDWSETDRYNLSITRVEARDMYSACSARTNGILRWIKERW